ncbi:MAG: UDP-N-acetylmuramoyl-L-alanine--D-glutamate ligase [Kiritimatiellae bacterium]|nr:UDP-N-acetylmuramoyl-L-alanine--D-glutamate ligase [Kiritimatiellia bacterium]
MANDQCKSVLILGLAASGEAAARLLLAEGRKVTVLDGKNTPEIRGRAGKIQKYGAVVFAGASKIPDGDFELCVVSPGVRPDSPVLKEIVSRGIPVLPEFELGWLRAKCPVIAVTGSNGKSTLVKLCAETMRLVGLKTFAAGNYGPPVSQIVLDHPALDWLVIEVSSFQLETARNFHPDIGVLLNVFPNHLDRHHDLRSYTAAKARLFARMTDKHRAVVNENNLSEINGMLGGKLRLVSFGLSAEADWFFRENFVGTRFSDQKVQLENTVFANEIMGQAAAAAAAVMAACKIPFSCLERAARDFKPLPHRLESVGMLRGVRFVDDSKATNAAALAAALKITAGKVRLIAGGLPKNESYAPLKPLLAEKASGVYLIGQAAGEMGTAWGETVACRICGTLEKAAAEAWREAVPGETILLSPACASFDQFRSFEERGRRFRQFYDSLAAEQAGREAKPAPGAKKQGV